MNRRRTLSTMGALGLWLGWSQPNPASAINATSSPGLTAEHWSIFKKTLISEDGRVIDVGSSRSQTFSEAQAYALFFALVLNDKTTFAKTLHWTEANLCQGDMTAFLPAWLWGRKDDNSWGVLDANSASDADLWLAYALGEAGRLWSNRRYSLLSNLLIARILSEETVQIPKLGLCLLPAPQGFVLDDQRWRLNPSYMPMHLMRWLAKYQTNVSWKKIEESSLKIILGSSPNGLVPEWTLYDEKNQFSIDTIGSEKGNGSYNAIRAYLWVGLLHQGYPHKLALLQKMTPMSLLVKKNGYPPESVDVSSGAFSKPGASGFSSALLPFLIALGEDATAHVQMQRIEAYPPRPDEYYAQALRIFGVGWVNGLYRFDVNGRLIPRWKVKGA